MKAKLFRIALSFFLVCPEMYAQDSLLKYLNKTEADGLHIGDVVPDLEFNNMYNFPGGRARLSDFKGKLVILDFWNLGCSPCIKSFPQMQQLQDEFGERIQIILVNVNDKKEVLERRGFPDKIKSEYIRTAKLPFAMLHAGTPVEYFFPAATLPYHVWIDGNRKIVAMTTGVGTTSTQIENFLLGRQTTVRVQPTLLDMGLGWNDKDKNAKSILQSGSKIVFENILSSSIITRNLSAKGFAGAIADSVSGKLVGVRASGSTIDLLRQTFTNQTIQDNPDRIVLEVDNPTDYTTPLDPESMATWEANHVYSYELKLPPNRMPEDLEEQGQVINKAMRDDLQRFFGLVATLEKRSVMCRILTRVHAKKLLQNSKQNTEFFKVDPDFSNIELRNCPFPSLTGTFQRAFLYAGIKPFLDETKINSKERVDIEIKGKLYDIELLRPQLKKYGLDIIEAERIIEVLVVKKSR